jgi:hypothetical protein
MKKKKCCICNKVLTGYGNNPAPVKDRGECCDACNAAVVIPARMAGAENIKTVCIPTCENHNGLYQTSVKLRWICPKCGKPRGETKIGRSYDGSAVLFCDTWGNPCGHIDKYSDLRAEAATNGLNPCINPVCKQEYTFTIKKTKPKTAEVQNGKM